MRKNKKIKCSKCNENAVIIENEIYYCGPCGVNKFIRMHERLRPKPIHNTIKSNCKT